MLQNIDIVFTIVILNIVIHFTAESIKLSRKKRNYKYEVQCPLLHCLLYSNGKSNIAKAGIKYGIIQPKATYVMSTNEGWSIGLCVCVCVHVHLAFL